MKIYYACPVRNVTPEFNDGVTAHVEHLEGIGHTVYFPPRDTAQDRYEMDICKANRASIIAADIVYVAWDGKSQGVLFDMGIAWALNKEIRTVIGKMPPATRSKSFQNLFFDWEDGS